MTPEDMTPQMQELNNRRVERHQRQQSDRVKRRKQKSMVAIGAAIMAAIGMLGLFFMLRAERMPEVEETQATAVRETTPDGATVIQLVAAGDVNVTDAIVASGGTSYDYTDTFLDVAHLLAEGDITVLNFEGNLCGAPYGTTSRSAPQAMAEALSRAGVDIVQLANSYSINHGISGLQASIQSVQDAGMEALGVYADERAYKAGKGYTIRDVQGVKIAFVAFTKGMDGMTLPQGSEHCVNVLYKDYDSTYQEVDYARITQVLEAVEKEKPDLTVAMLHWGSEYNDTIRENQKKIVNHMQELGVDAIIGSHPHYVQKMSYDPDTGFFVAYSLGDFLSDGTRAGTEYSVVLNLEITKNGNKTKITGYSYTPIFTVAERGKTIRSVRIAETMAAYDSNYIKRIKEVTYDSMIYALSRIEARVAGE